MSTQYHGFSWRHQAYQAVGLLVARLAETVPMDAFRAWKAAQKHPSPGIGCARLSIAYASSLHTMPVTQAVRFDKGQRIGSPVMQIP